MIEIDECVFVWRGILGGLAHGANDFDTVQCMREQLLAQMMGWV